MTEPTQANGHLLARIDERTKAIQKDITQLRHEVEEHERTTRETYVTREEFRPIRFVIYGLMGITMSSVVGAVITMMMH